MKGRLCLVLLLAGLPACRGGGQSVAPDGRVFPHVASSIDRNAPTWDDLAAFTYSGTDAGTVRLTGGAWRGAAPAGRADVPEVILQRTLRVTGDITGNGSEEAVVLLESRRPPAPSRLYLTVVGWIGGQLVNIATTPLSDQVELRGGHIEPKRIILDGVRRGSTDPIQLTYELTGSTLRLISGDPAATR